MHRTTRTLILLTGLLAALCLTRPNPAQAQVSRPVTSSVMIPLGGSFVTEYERVDLTGIVHLVTHYYPTDSYVTPNPIRISVNLIRVVGTGWTSGATYRATGAETFWFEQQPSSVYQFDAFFRLYPVDPARLWPVDPILPLSFSVSLDSAGRISTAIARVGSGSPFGD